MKKKKYFKKGLVSIVAVSTLTSGFYLTNLNVNNVKAAQEIQRGGSYEIKDQLFHPLISSNSEVETNMYRTMV